MITKNIFRIHLLYYVVAFICFLTGHFKEFIIFSSIIVVHEVGHILAAVFFKWNIEKVILLPFGGITIFKENINKPLLQELIIALMGPFFQCGFYFIFQGNYIFNQFNQAILLFNLLPIFPLDGSKIWNVVSNYFLSFKYSHIFTIIISTFSILVIMAIGFKNKLNLLFLLVLLFLIIEIMKEIYRHKYYFNRFLLERYLYEFHFKKEKRIKKISQMKKQTRHIFKINNKYYTEREIIRKMFDN